MKRQAYRMFVKFQLIRKIMLNKIIEFSLNNRIVVLIGAVLLILAGTYTATNMEVDVFPI